MSVFSSGISSAHSTVTFGYSARHAISSELTDYFSFIGTDNNVSNSYMLTSIATATRSGTTNSAYNDVYSYYIKYEAYDPARSQNEALITSIQQCAKKSTSPSDCNTPYTFTWNTLNNGATAFLYKTNPTFSYSFNTLASYEPLEISRTKLADFNGDGIQDVFHYNGDYGSSAVSCDIWITEGSSFSFSSTILSLSDLIPFHFFQLMPIATSRATHTLKVPFSLLSLLFMIKRKARS